MAQKNRNPPVASTQTNCLASIQKRVDSEIYSNLLLEEALLSGIANFRSIARKLSKKLPGAKIEAIAVAVRRHFEKESGERKSAEDALLRLLAKSKIKATTEVADFTLEAGERTVAKVSEIMRKISPRKGDIFRFVSGHRASTLVVDMENYSAVKRLARGLIIRERPNVSEIAIITDSQVEETLGWVALVSRLIARNGINMIETFSCYTETIIIVEEKDAGKVVEILSSGKRRR